MRISPLAAAWGNVRGRAGSSLSMIMIISALIAGLWALVIPLRDVDDNVQRHFSDPSWSEVQLVQGIQDAPEPMSPEEVAELAALPGVEKVTPVLELAGETADAGFATVRVPVPELAVPVVVGREPRPGACEAIVSRDWPDARLRGQAQVRLVDERSPAAVDARVVGFIERGYPLFDGPTMVTTCPLPASASASSYLVRTGEGGLPDRYVHASLAHVATRALESGGTTGIIGLVVLLLSVVAFVVLTSVGRWSSRLRKSELALLSLWGTARSRLLAMVTVEGVVLATVSAVVGGVCGTVLGWWLVRQGGPTSRIDPEAGMWAAVPSISSGLMVVLPVTVVLLLAMTASSARTLRKPVATLLRRRGE